MKRIVILIIGLMMLFTNVGQAMEKQGASFIDTSKSNLGIVSVKYANANDKKVKVMIEKDKNKYVYNLSSGNKMESFPLQLENGTYKISILENTEGTSYKPVMTSRVDVKLQDVNQAYLQSIQLIQWDDSMKAIQKAKELTEGMANDEEKIKAIYQYIVSNVKYDYEKIGNLSYDYLPQIDITLETNKGICYDYSSMFAAMLRSVNIPTKLVKGYAENVEGYHAWNEVLVDGKWIVADTTYDAQMAQNNKKYSMEKESKLYDKVNEY